MIKTSTRHAFTLIELLFSITIMGLVLLSLPPLFSSTSKNIQEILKTEALTMAFTRNTNINSYFWDDRSYDYKYDSFILDTQGDSELQRYPNLSSQRRRTANKRKFYAIVTYSTIPANLGPDSGENNLDDYDDMDDFDNFVQIVNKQKGDYVIDFKLNSHIYYIDDSADYSQQTITLTITPTPINKSTNVKMVETNVTTHDDKPILILRHFACNLGQARPLEEKSYQ